MKKVLKYLPYNVENDKFEVGSVYKITGLY